MSGNNALEAMLRRLREGSVPATAPTSDSDPVKATQAKPTLENVDWDTTLLTPYQAAHLLTEKRKVVIRPQLLYYALNSQKIPHQNGKVTLRDCADWLDRKKEGAGSVQAANASAQDAMLLAKINEVKAQQELSMTDLPDRKFGVEVEFDPGTFLRSEILEVLRSEGFQGRKAKYSDTNYDRWLVKTDRSCGMEVVSPPDKGYQALRNLIRVMKLLQRLPIEINRKCAFQVHWDAQDLSVDHLKRLVIAYTMWESVIDKLVTKSRRGDENEYAKSMKGINKQALIAANTIEEVIAAMKITVKLPDGGEVYNYRKWKLNLFKLTTTGSIEFRQHQGTLDPVKAVRWIALTGSMVEFAKGGGSIGAVNSITQLVRTLKLSDADLEYWKGRSAELEG